MNLQTPQPRSANSEVHEQASGPVNALATPGFVAVDFAAIQPQPCPCGTTRRALGECEAFPGSIHRVDVSLDARRHYHKRLTETYYILDCEPGAVVELDDQRIALHPGMCVVIRPLVRHRAVGRMTLLNIVFPKFDPADEWFDEPTAT